MKGVWAINLKKPDWIFSTSSRPFALSTNTAGSLLKTKVQESRTATSLSVRAHTRDHTSSSHLHVLTAATSLPPDCIDFHMSHKVNQSAHSPKLPWDLRGQHCVELGLSLGSNANYFWAFRLAEEVKPSTPNKGFPETKYKKYRGQEEQLRKTFVPTSSLHMHLHMCIPAPAYICTQTPSTNTHTWPKQNTKS